MAYRKEKIEEFIRRFIAEMLVNDEIKDPRIGFATITGVSLAKDYSIAHVGVSVYGDAREMRKTLQGLRSATGYIQHRLGKELRIRVLPRVAFFLDSSVAEGVDMVSLIDRLNAETGTGDDDEDAVGIPE